MLVGVIMNKLSRALLVALLVLSTLVGCGSGADLSGAKMEVWLNAPTQSVNSKDMKYRVFAELHDEIGKPILNERIKAEVTDANGTLVGNFGLKAVVGVDGQYQSESFIPPKDAVAGNWKVKAMAGSEKNGISAEKEQQVGETTTGLGFFLNVPVAWGAPRQDSRANGGSVLYERVSQKEHEEALFEIRYETGNVNNTAEAVRETLLSYYPYGYAKSSDYVEQVSEAAHSTHKGWIARGGIVTRFGADAAPTATATPRSFKAAQLRGTPTHTPEPTIRPDRNFTIQVLRFYCEQTDRTFTIIAASTSDTLLTEMWGVVASLDCHPNED